MRIVLDIPSKALDLDHTMSCGQVFRWTKSGDWWLGTLGKALVRMRQKELCLEIQSSTPISRSMVESYLRLDDDLSQILRELLKDRTFRRVTESVQGIRVLRQDPWECLVSYIISRNCNIPMIRRVLNNLCQRFGEEIVWSNHVGYSFPTPESICEAELLDLTKCRFRYGKRQALELKEMAKLVCEGVIDFDMLKMMPYVEAKATLMSLDHGVGNKVADCVLLFSLEKLEAFPVDVWIARAVVQLYRSHIRPDLVRRVNTKSPLTPQDYRGLSHFGRLHFGRYAGYAQEYLYHWKRIQENRCASEFA